MKITGSATPRRRPSSRSGTALHDPAVLVRTIPGCERLEEIGDDRYAHDGHRRGRLDQGHLRR